MSVAGWERRPLDVASFAVLDELAAVAGVAFVAEMDHFVAEKRPRRLDVLRYLVARGWTVVGEELDHRVGSRLDEYLRTGEESLLEPIDEPAWYAAGVLAGPAARFDESLLHEDRRRFVRDLRDLAPGLRYFGFDVGGDDAEYLELANGATTYEELVPAMALREQLMHRRVAQAMDEHPGAKVVLLAGSTHLLKDDRSAEAPGGTGPGGGIVPSIGHHTAQVLAGGPVLSFWLLHGEGTSANPYLPPPARLAPLPETVDAELLSLSGGPALVVVPDEDRRRTVTQMHNLPLTCRLKDQVDALVFTPTVTPLT